jgi:hypothetical protein
LKRLSGKPGGLISLQQSVDYKSTIIYIRTAYPNKQNFDFVRSLKLRAAMGYKDGNTAVPGEVQDELLKAYEAEEQDE